MFLICKNDDEDSSLFKTVREGHPMNNRGWKCPAFGKCMNTTSEWL